MSVMARRKRTRAARSPVVKRGPWRSCDPGEETGGIEMPLCCGAGEESCPPVSPVTGVTARSRRAEPVSRTRARSRISCASPAGAPAGSRPPHAAYLVRGLGRSRGICALPSASIATKTKYAEATCSEVTDGSFQGCASTAPRSPSSARPVDLGEGAHDVAHVDGVEERHLVHRRGDGRPPCRWATAPAVESASFMISPPWMLPSRFASRSEMMTPSDTRAYDGGGRASRCHGAR